MTFDDIPTWDPLVFFPTPGPDPTWHLRPTTPCGDCGAGAWVILRADWRGQPVVWTVCGACADAGRMATWPDTRRVVVLGCYPLGANEPRWLPRGVPSDKHDLLRFARVPATQNPSETRPSLQETA